MMENSYIERDHSYYVSKVGSSMGDCFCQRKWFGGTVYVSENGLGGTVFVSENGPGGTTFVRVGPIMSNQNGPGGPYLSTKMVRGTDFVDIFGPPGPFLGGTDFCMTFQRIQL